jgi:3-isopropylmalate dehydrogenase
LKYTIALIPGDGIGPEQAEATLKVLEAVQEVTGLGLEFAEVEAGDGCLKRRGVALPDDAVEAIKAAHACLKGPVGETAAEVIVKLRLLLDLYANVRPVKSYPNTPCLRPDVDFVIVRENTEDVYKGYEFRTGEEAICLRVITKRGCERIAKYAFEMAESRRKKLVAVHKANVMKMTCGLFAEVCREEAKAHPEVEFRELYVDAAVMNLIRNPQDFDVIVTTNLFGDILSEEGAQIAGGLGIAPSANVGDDHGLFEPIHGSAPDIAGRGIANPCSLILSAKLMLEWLSRRHEDPACKKAADLIEEAFTEALRDGVKTPDLGGNMRTKEVGNAIAERIRG